MLDARPRRGLDVAELSARTHAAAGQRRTRSATPTPRYCWPTDGLDGVTLAPFQILAAEGRALAAPSRTPGTSQRAGRLEGGLITPTGDRLSSTWPTEQRAEAAATGGLELTAAGGEGMVVKPGAPRPRARVQPGIKVRGREYLRIIYGPDYTDAARRAARALPRPQAVAGAARARPRPGGARPGSPTASRCGGSTSWSSRSWRSSPSRSTPGCDDPGPAVVGSTRPGWRPTGLRWTEIPRRPRPRRPNACEPGVRQ